MPTFSNIYLHECVTFLTPGIPLSLRAKKPEILANEGNTFAGHLRRKRLELGLTQQQAAAIMGTNEWSLRNWERGRPSTVRFFPGIIRFLGCEPWPEPTTLGQRLLAERRRRGLPRGEAADLVGVDESAFWRWETDQWRVHSHRCQEIVEAFLSGPCP